MANVYAEDRRKRQVSIKHVFPKPPACCPIKMLPLNASALVQLCRRAFLCNERQEARQEGVTMIALTPRRLSRDSPASDVANRRLKSNLTIASTWIYGPPDEKRVA